MSSVWRQCYMRLPRFPRSYEKVSAKTYTCQNAFKKSTLQRRRVSNAKNCRHRRSFKFLASLYASITPQCTEASEMLRTEDPCTAPRPKFEGLRIFCIRLCITSDDSRCHVSEITTNCESLNTERTMGQSIQWTKRPCLLLPSNASAEFASQLRDHERSAT
jgi:hypothetical protein